MVLHQKPDQSSFHFDSIKDHEAADYNNMFHSNDDRD